MNFHSKTRATGIKSLSALALISSGVFHHSDFLHRSGDLVRVIVASASTRWSWGIFSLFGFIFCSDRIWRSSSSTFHSSIKYCLYVLLFFHLDFWYLHGLRRSPLQGPRDSLLLCYIFGKRSKRKKIKTKNWENIIRLSVKIFLVAAGRADLLNHTDQMESRLLVLAESMLRNDARTLERDEDEGRTTSRNFILLIDYWWMI